MALGELGYREAPEVVGSAGEIVTFHHGRGAVAEFDELELVIIGDEAEAVFAQVAANLPGLGERGEAFAGRLDFNRATFGALVRKRLSLATIGNWEKTAIRQTRAAATGMSDKDDAWLESFAHGVE